MKTDGLLKAPELVRFLWQYFYDQAKATNRAYWEGKKATNRKYWQDAQKTNRRFWHTRHPIFLSRIEALHKPFAAMFEACGGNYHHGLKKSDYEKCYANGKFTETAIHDLYESARKNFKTEDQIEEEKE